MILRRVKTEDVPKIAELEIICFPVPWSAAMIKAELANPFAYYIAAVEDGVIIGYGGMRVMFETADITNVACAPEYRRRGVGRAIMEEMICRAKELGVEILTLEVRESNSPAQALYRKLGFEVVGRRKGYYEKPKEDALLMGLRM